MTTLDGDGDGDGDVDGEGAALACRYVVSRVQHASRERWVQGARKTSWTTNSLDFAVEIVARHRLHRVCEPAARALVEWANGRRPVEATFEKPSARDLLALQARGRRCVSLLGPIDAEARDDEGLEFALHDLCHLEKFVDPQHHRGQVGFFRAVHEALDSDAWRTLDARLDDAWRRDLESVVADMNGSPVFLFAALKMRLRMASRRRLARARGVEAPTSGVLDDDELRAFDDDLDLCVKALDLPCEIALDARAISTRRDAHDSAERLLSHFVERGA